MAFTIHAYRVVPFEGAAPLADLLHACAAQSLDQRIRTIGADEMRLEALEQREGLIYLDFVLFRNNHGPGRAHRRRDIQGFNFDREESFGEETAAIYDPRRQAIVIEYNHAGARSGRIGKYLSEIDGDPDNQYDLEVRYDEAVEERLRHKQIIKKLSFRVATQRLERADRRAGVPLSRALEMGQEFGAEHIEIRFTAGRRRGQALEGSRIRNTLDWLARRMGIDENSVESLTVVGKENPDEKAELLNLLGHRLHMKLDDLPLGTDLRYEREVRWVALRRAYNGWRRVL